MGGGGTPIPYPALNVDFLPATRDLQETHRVRHRENILCSSLAELLLILGFSLWAFNDNRLKAVQ